MKMNATRFANLISWLSIRAERVFGVDDCAVIEQTIDDGIDIEAARIDPDNLDGLLGFMQDGRKLEAIAAYKQMTGLGLKESKDVIERYWQVSRSEIERVVKERIFKKLAATPNGYSNHTDEELTKLEQVIREC